MILPDGKWERIEQRFPEGENNSGCVTKDNQRFL